MTMQNIETLKAYAAAQVRRQQALAAEQAALLRELGSYGLNSHDTVVLHRYCAGHLSLVRRWAGVERRAS